MNPTHIPFHTNSPGTFWKFIFYALYIVENEAFPVDVSNVYVSFASNIDIDEN